MILRNSRTGCGITGRGFTGRGFTLVEMLVVISIIVVLAALLLPAVNMAREAGRRSSCSNNLRNLAIAAQAFDQAKGNYPASRTFWNDAIYKSGAGYPQSIGTQPLTRNVTLTWVHEIMPYIERQDMRSLIETNLRGGTAAVYQSAFGKINIVLCPSDEIDDALSPNFDVTGAVQLPYSQLSYGCNGGVTDNPSGAGVATSGVDWPANGAFDNRLKGSTDNLKTYKTGLGDIAAADGASNTILFAENSDLEEWSFAPTEYQVAILWDDVVPPSQLLNKYPPYPGGAPNVKPDVFSVLAGASNLGLSPPQYDALAYARPSSQHPTGFMLAFCDGRVKFVSESISYLVYAKLMTSNDKKYFPAGYAVNTPSAQAQAQTIRGSLATPLKDGDY